MYVDDDARNKIDSVKEYLKSSGQTGASRSDAIREMFRGYIMTNNDYKNRTTNEVF